MSKTKQQPSTPNSKPVDRIAVHGTVISIFRNANDKGDVWYSFVPQRTFRDKQTDEWRYAEGFSHRDLLSLARAAELAHTKGRRLQAADSVESDEPTS